MPMLGLPLNDHQVLKLDAVECFLGTYNDADDEEDRDEVDVEVVSDLGDPVM